MTEPYPSFEDFVNRTMPGLRFLLREVEKHQKTARLFGIDLTAYIDIEFLTLRWSMRDTNRVGVRQFNLRELDWVMPGTLRGPDWVSACYEVFGVEKPVDLKMVAFARNRLTDMAQSVLSGLFRAELSECR